MKIPIALSFESFRLHSRKYRQDEGLIMRIHTRIHRVHAIVIQTIRRQVTLEVVPGCMRIEAARV
jgi:hypothetical protein